MCSNITNSFCYFSNDSENNLNETYLVSLEQLNDNFLGNFLYSENLNSVNSNSNLVRYSLVNNGELIQDEFDTNESINEWTKSDELPLNLLKHRNADKPRSYIQYGTVRDQFQFETFEEAFKLYLTPELIQQIVNFTNQKATKLKHRLDLTSDELYAFIGLVILSGTYKENDTEVNELWSEDDGRAIYSGCIGRDRFKLILRYFKLLFYNYYITNQTFIFKMLDFRQLRR